MPRRIAAADAPVHAVECPSFLKDYVRSLIVAGRTIVENGVVRSVDLAALESELLGQARAAWPPALAASKLRRRYQNALAEFYRCGCHQRPDPEGR